MTPWQRGTVPAAAVDLVATIEAFRAVPYNDGFGTWTQGYGATVGDDGKPITGLSPPISQATAEEWLKRDLAAAAEAVDREVQAGVALTENQAAALISFAFNEGAGALARSTLLRTINAGHLALAPATFRAWVFANGQPALGLLRRRWAEAATFNGSDPVHATLEAWRLITALGQWPAFPA